MGDTLSNLQGRLPNTRRVRTLYEELDKLAPNWRFLVADPSFPAWANFVDSDSGTRMVDRIQCLIDDPLYAAKDLALIFRLFASDKPRQAPSAGGLLARLFRQQPKPAVANPRQRYGVLAGKYELIRLLGRGGNGEVFLVWSTETRTFYALKTIRQDLVVSSEARKAFRDEAGLWIRMAEHPNVAKAFYFEDIHPNLYITMAVVEGDDDATGPSLADKIEAKPLSEDAIIRWFGEVAAGLHHAYLSGIRAHRDIKPGNILITREGVAQISDFGLAVPVESQLDCGDTGPAACGTPIFMSPEQFANVLTLDERSDVYSLGVTLYQTVSGGKAPFLPRFTPTNPADLHRYFAEIRALHESQAPMPLRSNLWPVIEKCLNKKPIDRFQSVIEFRNALKTLARGLVPELSEVQPSIEDFWALRDQGNTFLRLGDYQAALSYFERFLAIIPDDGARLNRALCLQNLGRHEDALREFEVLSQLDDSAPIINMVGCLIKLKRIPEAIACGGRAVSSSPEESTAWLALGNARYAAAMWPGAAEAYARAHHLNPEDPTPLYNLGLATYEGGMRDLAAKAFREFLERSSPDDSRRSYVESTLAKGL